MAPRPGLMLSRCHDTPRPPSAAAEPVLIFGYDSMIEPSIILSRLLSNRVATYLDVPESTTGKSGWSPVIRLTPMSGFVMVAKKLMEPSDSSFRLSRPLLPQASACRTFAFQSFGFLELLFRVFRLCPLSMPVAYKHFKLPLFWHYFFGFSALYNFSKSLLVNCFTFENPKNRNSTCRLQAVADQAVA